MYAEQLNRVVVLLFACFLITGCATTQKIADDILGKEPTLKKKIAFIPISNTYYKEKDLDKSATIALKAFLERSCDSLVITEAAPVLKALEKIPQSPPGHIDNLALAEAGRIYGLGAILEQHIDTIRHFTDKRGIWGLRKIHTFLRISLRVRAYDVETTSVLLDEIIEDEVEVSQEAWQERDDISKLENKIAQPLIIKIANRVASIVCDRLSEVPWKGYITGSTNGTVNLSAGKDVGLTIGDILEVFAIGEPIKGPNQHVYLVPGPKIGEIKVAKVYKHHAEATVIFGDDLEKSTCVRVKPQ